MKKQHYQIGGKVATTKKQQMSGLNDNRYDQMHFPVLDNPVRQFRGLDNGQGVAIIDQLGRQKVLYGPQDTAQMYGPVSEQRINSWAPSWGQQMQTGGYGPRKDVPKEMIDPSGRSHYDPYTGKMYLTPQQYNNPDVYNHESFHEYQDRMGRLSVPEQWGAPLKRPSIVNTDDIKGDYFNRQGLDANIIGNEFIRRYPEAQFLPNNITHRYKDPRNAPPDKVFERFIDPIRYSQPWTVEGEADQYEHEQHNGNYNSIVDRVMSNNRTYQTGGRAPIYVTDPHDPRLQAYQDSTNAYKYATLAGKLYSNQGNAAPDAFRNAWDKAMHYTADRINKNESGDFESENNARYKPKRPVYLQKQDIQPLPVDREIQPPAQQIMQERQPIDTRPEVWSSPVTNYNGQGFRPAGFYKQDVQQYGGSQNTTDMAKKQTGYTAQGFKYGGNKLGGAAIITDTNPYGQGTANVPVEYQRAQNGMMQMGGRLSGVAPQSRQEYVDNKYKTLMTRYPKDGNMQNWTNDEEQAYDTRGEQIRALEGTRYSNPTDYPINPRTLTPMYPKNYDVQNKPQFTDVQNPQMQEEGYQMGGAYLDYTASNPALPNSNMQYGGVQFVNDKEGYNQMQNPGHHWTNEGWKRSTGSTNNGASFSRFGGPSPSNGLPAPLEYAYLQNGGWSGAPIPTANNLRGQEFGCDDNLNYQYGGESPDMMKDGGIKIKKSHEGRFTEYKKRTGKTTEEALHSDDPHVRKMAQFAKNAKSWAKKEFGGEVAGKLSKFIKMQMGGEIPTKPNIDWGDTPENPSELPDQQPKPQEDPNDLTPRSDPNRTGVVPDQDQQTPAWRKGMTDQQATQNINYGAGSANAFDPNTGNTDNGPGSFNARNKQARRTAARDATGNLLGAGLATASYFEDRRNQRNMAGYNRQQGLTDNTFGAQKLNTQGNKGDYNQSGNFRPNQNTPYAPGITYPTAATGGHYSRYGGMPTAQMGGFQNGGVYELPEEHIEKLRKQGYQIEYV